MESKELRIGNYLHDRNDNLCKVIELRQDGIYAPAINEAITGLPNKPIELTEQLVLNFGFDNTETGWEIIYRKQFKFSVILFKKFASVGMSGPFGLFEVKLKYVHQLQNLYFALTGEELTIKYKENEQ